MKVEFTNLAHVNEAKIEDADLTILIGDNGTGKTLILEALALLRKSFLREIDKSINKFMKNYADKIKVDLDWDFLREKINYVVHDKDLVLDEEGTIELIDLIQKEEIGFVFKDVTFVNNYFNEAIKESSERVKMEVIKNVLLTENSSFDFKLIDLPDFKEKYKCTCSFYSSAKAEFTHLILEDDNRKVSGTVVNRINRFYNIDEEISRERKYDLVVDINKIIDLIENKLKQMIIKYVYSIYFKDEKLLFLPSERNLFMKNALTKASLSSIEQNGEEKKYLEQRYSERLFNSDYIRFIDLNRQIPSMFSKARKKIESLIGGELIVSKDGEIESIKRKDGTEIKRPLFSTMQNRLIPFLLIHSPIERYDFIIIEEPEAHMSLKSIVSLIEYIKELIDSNIRICISTHSDVFFSYINNSILRDQKDLSVGVYELKSDGNKSVLEKKERGEYGYQIDLFTEELEYLYNETLEIQEKLDD